MLLLCYIIKWIIIILHKYDFKDRIVFFQMWVSQRSATHGMFWHICFAHHKHIIMLKTYPVWLLIHCLCQSIHVEEKLKMPLNKANGNRNQSYIFEKQAFDSIAGNTVFPYQSLKKFLNNHRLLFIAIFN